MSNSALIEDLERQFSENPRRVFARLANEYRKSGNLEGAIALCREHVPKHPGYISGHIVLGQALFESGSIEEAREAFQAALQLDPENLIALRHLGDIARRSGDGHEASMWYQRLLEVDPQNEEAAAQLHALEAGELPEAPSTAPAAPADAVEGSPFTFSQIADGPAAEVIDPAAGWGEINPEAAASASEELAAVSDALADVEADSPATERDGEETDLLSFGEGEFDVAEASPQGQPAADGVATDDVLEDELFDLPAPPTAVARQRDGVAAMPSTPLDEDGFGSAGIVPELDPFEELPDRAQPVDFAMPTEDVVTFDAEAPEPRATLPDSEPRDPFAWPSTDDERRDGPALASAEEQSPGQPPEAAADEYLLPQPQAEPALVTETVAELYERQGHLAQSLDVYRQLAEQNPHNDALRLHVARLEAELASASPMRPAGPSARALFRRVLERRPPAAATDALPFRNTTASPGSADDRAAATLAGAFAPGFSAPSESGRPARTAHDELSLDAIFGRTQPRNSERNGEVSYDQFFPPHESGGQTEASTPPARGSDDDEIFHSWLDGLKR